MTKILTVALRECSKHLRKPSFYVATLGIPLLLVLLLFISNQAHAAEEEETQARAGVGDTIRKDELKPFGYVDHSQTITLVPAGFPAGFVKAYPDEAAGRAALQADEISLLYVLPADYRQTGEVNAYQSGLGFASNDGLRRLFRPLLLTNLLPSQDLPTALRIEQPMLLETKATALSGGGDGGQESQDANLFLATSFALILAMSIFLSAGILLQAVVEEKENRTIEVMLSSLSPLELLAGKVGGLGLLGLLQMLLWLGVGYGLLGTGDQLFAVIETISIPAEVWVLALLYYLLGYLLFATLMAGLGAVSASMKEGSQLAVVFTLPAALPLILLQPLAADPNGGLAVWFSLFPLTAPATMLLRLTSGEVPIWQLLLSVALLVLGIAGALWGASRLFRATTLLTGKQLSLREIGRALRA